MPSSFVMSQRALRMKPSSIREILKLTHHHAVTSFAGGLPTPRCFPYDELNAAYNDLLSKHTAAALQYGSTEGFLPLREWVVGQLEKEGVKGLSVDNVMIVSGSQQALDLMGKLMIDEGSKVLLESPSYLGAIQSFSLYGPRFTTVPVDKDGVQVDAITPEVSEGARFFYVLPNFQNPTGVTLSLERRKALVELAAERQLVLLEDDPYGQLRYHGEEKPSLFALGHQVGAPVVLMRSFSKVVAPGMRLAYVVAPADVIERLTVLKQASDLHTSTVNQMAIHELLMTGYMDNHIQVLRSVYRDQCQFMINALERYFPKTAHWNHPEGGMFLWVDLPGVDTKALLRDAIEQKDVAFVPGEAFYAEPMPTCSKMRLSFVTVDEEAIEQGIQRLSTLL